MKRLQLFAKIKIKAYFFKCLLKNLYWFRYELFVFIWLVSRLQKKEKIQSSSLYLMISQWLNPCGTLCTRIIYSALCTYDKQDVKYYLQRHYNNQFFKNYFCARLNIIRTYVCRDVLKISVSEIISRYLWLDCGTPVLREFVFANALKYLTIRFGSVFFPTAIFFDPFIASRLLIWIRPNGLIFFRNRSVCRWQATHVS